MRVKIRARVMLLAKNENVTPSHICFTLFRSFTIYYLRTFVFAAGKHFKLQFSIFVFFLSVAFSRLDLDSY